MLSREECLQILGLPEDANPYDIERRYTVLVKRYRGQTDPETIQKLDQITLAYNILTGRYVEPEPIDPRLEKVIFGKTLYTWLNLWHYWRWPLLGILFGAIFVGSLVYSIVTNKPPDFQLVAAGQFYVTDDAESRIKQYVCESIEGVETVEFQFIPLSFDQPEPTGTDLIPAGADPESEYAYVMKMMALIAGDTIEMYICEKSVFDQYAPQGAFYELDQVYHNLSDLPEDVLSKIKPLRRVFIEDYEETENAEQIWPDEEAMNKDTSLPIYGLDVTELELLEGVGLYGKSQILTIGVKGDHLEQVEQFVEHWIRDYEKMHEARKAYEEALKEKTAASASE